ncbi:MAG: hypothetical protein RR777_06990 [Christensenellaceae bacterium]
MAYENFKPMIWSKQIESDLALLTVMQEDCNTKHQGEVGMGKTVKIIGATRPIVGTYVPGTEIAEAQTPPDTSVLLKIDQYKYTHFMIDDVDNAQALDGLMSAYMLGSATELAQARDSYIASLAKEAGECSASAAITTAEAAKKAVDKAFVYLWDNSVKIGTNVSIVVTPWFYDLFKDKLQELSTDNTKLISKGVVGLYNGAYVKITNNLYNDGTDDYMMIRTKDAIAFAGGIAKTEPYRPDRQFADAVKVLDTYGAKVVRPKEMYVIKARAN